MAHAADFHGDKLRLSAFLRVLKKAPDRPKRLQRDRRVSFQADSGRAVGETYPPATDLVPSAEATRTGGLTTQCDTISEHDAWIQPAGSLGSPKIDVSTRTGSASELPELPEHTSPVAEDAHPGMPVAFPATKRRKIVYGARKKQSKPPMGVLNARKRHQLPEAGLALVRTSTEDGLPLPGGAETLLAEPVAENDPIEDLQLDNVPHKSRELRYHPGIVSSVNSQKSRVARASVNASHGARVATVAESEPVRYRGFLFTRPIRKKRRLGRNSLTGSAALCDGFVGQEVMIQAPQARWQKHAQKRQKQTRTCKAECSSSESRTELQLTKGFLPVPRAPSPTMPKEHGTQREFEHAWVENEIEEVGEDCVEAALQRRITSTSVRAQLSSVTAPFREDDSSDSNSDDESEADISGWGLEDVAESSWRPDFMSDTDRMDSTEDFGEVMYGMHNRDEYPLQYPGLD